MNRPTSKPGFGLFYIPLLEAGQFPHDVYQKMLDQITLADSYGWNNVWVSEHHATPYGGIIPNPAVFLAYAAAQTKQIRLGPAISILPFHRRIDLAEAYAMVDQFSQGRLDFGVGRGFLPHEADLFAMADFSPDAMSDHLKEITQLWRVAGKPSDQATPSDLPRLFPAPFQAPHPPIWIAASKSQTSFELAGRTGSHLMINPYTRKPEEVKQGIEWYRIAREKAGYGDENIRITAVQHLYCGSPDAVVENALNHYLSALGRAYAGASSSGNAFLDISFNTLYPEKTMIGEPDFLLERIQAFQEMGVTDFCFLAHFGNLPWERSLESIRRFSEEVMPASQMNRTAPQNCSSHS